MPVWHPGPRNIVPSKLQLLGMESVYATMLKTGSNISTCFSGPKSLAAALLPLSVGVVLPSDAGLPGAADVPPAVACPPHATVATSAATTRIPNADFVFIEFSVPTWPSFYRRPDAYQPRGAVYILRAPS